MSFQRRKDVQWELPEFITWSEAKVALLMDLRDELQSLGASVRCASGTLNRLARDQQRIRLYLAGPVRKRRKKGR